MYVDAESHQLAQAAYAKKRWEAQGTWAALQAAAVLGAAT